MLEQVCVHENPELKPQAVTSIHPFNHVIGFRFAAGQTFRKSTWILLNLLADGFLTRLYTKVNTAVQEALWQIVCVSKMASGTLFTK